MLDTLARMRVSNGRYTGTSDITGWADSVLSHGSDGVQQVLYNLLDMVKPQSALFGGKSLFEIYHQQLQGNLPKYREKMPRKVTQVYALIGGGYAVWITALRIKGRTSEIQAKAQEAQQKLQSLEPSLGKYFRYGSCPNGYQLKSRTCYKAFNSFKTWTDADAYCRTQGPGGMLAMAKDSGINSFLISLKDAASNSWGFWFGLNDRAREGSWKWPDGSSLGSYKYWSPIEPNNGGKNWWGTPLGNEDCVEFFRTGWRNSNWNDADCGKTRYFICQRTPEGL
ncbi:CD209 antigen-like protein C [Branchiostoma floridae]|uniref:CD209 antigen-like protein C n=2 Tax=Branchiostoma floridae TaxID=7739 RepID=A0A9J7HME3_BRAFL|nr:CD209 antigen-like protein C [Branchiostoma floridae]